MTTSQRVALNAEILRNLSTLSESEDMLARIAKYLRKLVKEHLRKTLSVGFRWCKRRANSLGIKEKKVDANGCLFTSIRVHLYPYLEGFPPSLKYNDLIGAF